MDSTGSSLNTYPQVMSENRHGNSSLHTSSSSVSTVNNSMGITSETQHQKLVVSDIPVADVTGIADNTHFTNFVHGHQQQLSEPVQIQQPSHILGMENERKVSSVIVSEPQKEIKNSGVIPTGISQNNLETEKDEVKTENDSHAEFIQAAYDVFLKVSKKEMSIKAASDTLGRPYFFTYSRYQEFCDQIATRGKMGRKKKKGGPGRKKRRIKLTMDRPWRKRPGEKIYQCEKCPKIFSREASLKFHNKVHNGNNDSHACTVCGMVFQKLTKLMKHRIEIHKDILKCPHCESQFTNIHNYQFHVRIHTGEKSYKCDECGKMFTHPTNLRVHQQRHKEEKPFMCGYPNCGKTFFTLGNLKSHRYVHTGGKRKPYECEICGNRYIQKSTLDTHMVVHTGEKPYSCRFCERKFAFRANMMHHEMLHTGEQPFQCDLCPAKFCQSIALQRHKIAHTGEKPYKCHLCEYACTRKRNLDLHSYTHTGETPFKCDFYGCAAEFGRPRELKKHKLQHGPPVPHSCKICNQQFIESKDLRNHMMTHTGQKPLTCDECFKTCADESSLKRHMYKHMYRPEGQKIKQVRHPKTKSGSRTNPVETHAETTESAAIAQKKMWPTNDTLANQVQVQVNTGHNSLGHPASSVMPPVSGTVGQYTWNINTEQTNIQPHFSSVPTNVWPSSMDPDEFRRRLLQSFKQ